MTRLSPLLLVVLSDHRHKDVPAQDGRKIYGRAQLELYRRHFLKRAPAAASRQTHPPSYRASALGRQRLDRETDKR